MPALQYDDAAGGFNPANLVVNERLFIEDSTARVFVVQHGAFYLDELELTYVGSGLPVDMEKVRFVGLDPLLTAASGRTVISGLEFPDDVDDPIILDTYITYHAVGGEQGQQTYFIKKLREAIEALDMGEISIGDIADFPPTWPPGPHGHDLLSDITGLEPIRDELAEIKDALVARRPVYNSGVRISDELDRVKYLFARLRNDVNTLRTMGSSVSVTSSELNFRAPAIHGSAGSPLTGAITSDLTGAKLGIVQQIYHNDELLDVPGTWVLVGSGAYVPDELNIIWVQWGQGTRVEYWIAQVA